MKFSSSRVTVSAEPRQSLSPPRDRKIPGIPSASHLEESEPEDDITIEKSTTCRHIRKLRKPKENSSELPVLTSSSSKSESDSSSLEKALLTVGSPNFSLNIESYAVHKSSLRSKLNRKKDPKTNLMFYKLHKLGRFR